MGGHRTAVFCCLLALTLAGVSHTAADERHDLTFRGDASFSGPHGGQAIHVVVTHAAKRVVVARRSGTVSAEGDPAFLFTFEDLLPRREWFEVRYWIDSNLGGGTMGKCDPKDIDHQWVRTVGALKAEDVTLRAAHLPEATADVCQSFGS